MKKMQKLGAESEKKELSMRRALWDALRGEPLDHYPLEGETPKETIRSVDILRRIGTELKDVKFASPQDAKTYIDRAKDSLEEVKKLTEYQDQKAARLLTIIAFLTAAAGAMFSKIVDTYPLHKFIEASVSFADVLVWLTYASFVTYVALVVCGALVTFHATQTRFVWPEGDPEDASADSVKSFLFYRSILTTKPEAWGRAFHKASVPSKPSDAMLSAYYGHYVAEAYLVACKVGDKLRYLGPAQAILLVAIRVLLLWIVVLVVTFVVAHPPPKDDALGESASNKVGVETTISRPTINALGSLSVSAEVPITDKRTTTAIQFAPKEPSAPTPHKPSQHRPTP
jgi:hypothetical protein